MRKNTNPDFHAAPLPVFAAVSLFMKQNNSFEWHFTLRGPTETPYEKGVYHGKIVLPSDFPMSPPDIYFFTVQITVFCDLQENGRFEVNKKICLTITSFHKEEWSPSWTSTRNPQSVSLLVETIITAISSMFPVPTPGAIGSIETPDEEVRSLAQKVSLFHRANSQSTTYKCPKCGEIRKIVRPRLSPVSNKHSTYLLESFSKFKMNRFSPS